MSVCTGTKKTITSALKGHQKYTWEDLVYVCGERMRMEVKVRSLKTGECLIWEDLEKEQPVLYQLVQTNGKQQALDYLVDANYFKEYDLREFDEEDLREVYVNYHIYVYNHLYNEAEKQVMTGILKKTEPMLSSLEMMVLLHKLDEEVRWKTSSSGAVKSLRAFLKKT